MKPCLTAPHSWLVACTGQHLQCPRAYFVCQKQSRAARHVVVVSTDTVHQVCHPYAEEGDVRLAGGAVSESSEYGRLEIFSGGGWGAVCNARFRQDVSTFVDVFDARFTEAAISVACRQLGYAAGAITVLPVRSATLLQRMLTTYLPCGLLRSMPSGTQPRSVPAISKAC